MIIPFHKTYSSSKDEEYILEAFRSTHHSGNVDFGQRAISFMRKKYGYQEIFLSPSGTASLEMGVLLAGLKPGDEVILPSYTFSSTVNSVVIFGCIPVFCEIDENTMNIDVSKIEELITPKTKMILPIDYAGNSCEMDEIMRISKKYNLIVMQDSAQSYGGFYKNRANGSIPHLAAFSFHETKNLNSGGEGGGLVVNVEEWQQRASFMQEKGTDRRLVLDGIKSKYSWVEVGSSYLLSDILAAALLAQLEIEDEIIEKRRVVTNAYFNLFQPFFKSGKLKIYQPKKHIVGNHHAFWVVFDSVKNKLVFIEKLKNFNIQVFIGYMPLHSAPMGAKFGYKPEDLPITESAAARLVRLPFYTSLADEGLDYTIEKMSIVLKEIYG